MPSHTIKQIVVTGSSPKLAKLTNMDLLDTSNAEKVRDLIENAKHIAVIPSKVAGADAFSAAVGLYYMLLEKDKQVSLVHTGKWPEVCNDLITKEQVASDIFARELVVNIDYSNTPAAKVHYFTENDILTLKVTPIDRNFDLSRVKAHLSGFDFDVVFMVGVQETYDLGQTYKELQYELSRAKVVNIDNMDRNTRFGYVNVVDTTADNLSMVVYKNAQDWGLGPSLKSAKALLTGMTYKNVRVDK